MLYWMLHLCYLNCSFHIVQANSNDTITHLSCAFMHRLQKVMLCFVLVGDIITLSYISQSLSKLNIITEMVD